MNEKKIVIDEDNVKDDNEEREPNSVHILILNCLWYLLVWNTTCDDSASDTIFSSDTFLKDSNRMENRFFDEVSEELIVDSVLR